MKGSIFRRWLTSAVAIAIAILLLLTLTITYVVQRDYYRQGLKQLSARADTVKRSYEEWRSGELTPLELGKELRRLEREDDVSLAIIGRKAKAQALRQELSDLGVKPDAKSWVAAVAAGERIETIAKYRRQDRGKMLIVGFPLRQNGEDGEVVASAFLYKPVDDARRLAAPVRRSIWLVALVCALPLVGLLWLAARRLVRPIRRMDAAAAALAAGDFSGRAEVRGDDEIARLGASFNAMAEKLERVEEQRRRLIMEISHELRTPITSIRGTLQAISDGLLDGEEREEFVRLSLAESKRLGQLVDQLQELSAFEEHRVKFDFQTVELRELAEQTALTFQPRAEAAGMELRWSLESGGPLRVRADPARLRQVLVNLIGNALDHNPAGTTVTVELRRQGGRAALAVRDDGPGIAPEHLSRLFERMYKAESSRASKGSGLGLTISRHIVLAHGGTIEAASEPWRGTELRVELPLLRA